MDSETAIELTRRALSGNRRAVGQVISLLERDGSWVDCVMREVYPKTGKAFTVGVTGPPGAGKSTIVDELVRAARDQGLEVAVLAVDPNSPFSGGAILGDRVRMMRHSEDSGVFIRSMGARGHLGGLAVAARNTVLLLDAIGRDLVILETVGVGQSELEIADNADTTVVVISPGQGDGIQAIKAGILEIADIYVVNKADHPYAARAVADIRELQRMELAYCDWSPPIVQTVATRNEGIDELWKRIQQHQTYLEGSGQLKVRREQRLKGEIIELSERRLRTQLLEPRISGPGFERLLQLVVDRRMDPYRAAEHIVPARPFGNALEDA